MRIIILFSLLLLQCVSGQDKSVHQEHYKIINDALTTHRTENEIGDDKLRLNPVFSGFVTVPSTYSDIEFLKAMSSSGFNIKYCDDFLKPDLKVDEYLGFYEDQLKFLKTNINFNKVIEGYIPYKTVLENPENIKLLKAFRSTNTKVSPEVLKERRRKQLLHQENGFFEISYPLISFNKREAVILITSKKVGYTLWFYEKKDSKWRKKCYRNYGVID